jgi:hypothetical protein
MSLISEPEIETFLHQLFPNLDEQIKGATDKEIQKIEEIAGQPLPNFYYWFLSRMGTDMGPLSYPVLDFSASKIISCYEKGLFQRHTRFLLIGYCTEDYLPQHLFYDFDFPVRDDTRVAEAEDLNDEMSDQFETLREMIAWNKLIKHKIWKFPQQCVGFFISKGEDILDKLNPVMTNLGFVSPIPTGNCCALYDSGKATLVTSSNPSTCTPDSRLFTAGGINVEVLRYLLGDIATKTSLELEVTKWEPHS